MIDTHAHLNLPPLSQDTAAVWQRATEAGVSKTIVIGTELKSSQSAIEIAHNLSGVYAAVGIHPDVVHPGVNVADITLSDWEAKLLDLAKNEKVVGIGECGLDYVELHGLDQQEAMRLKNLQKQLFGMQVNLSKALGLPLSIHCRNTRKADEQGKHGLDAYSDLFDTLEHFCKDDGILPKFVLHCMSGDQNYLEAGLKRGGFISFAGNITYPSASNLRQLLQATPLDRLLLETDAPFLSPQSSRGTPNEPAKVSETYEYVAKFLGTHRDELERIIDTNVGKLFPEL